MADNDVKLRYSPTAAIEQDRGEGEPEPDPIHPMSPRGIAMAWHREGRAIMEVAFAVIYFSVIILPFLYLIPIITKALVTVTPPEAIMQSLPDNVNSPRVTGFWRDYMSLVAAVEQYEDWFSDVDAGTYAIAVLEATVATPLGPVLSHEQEYNFHKWELVEARSKQVGLAKEIWKEFLERREKVVAHLVHSAASGRVFYTNGVPIKDGKGGEIDLRIIANWTVEGEAAETNPLNEYSAAALARSARMITYEIVSSFGILSGDVLKIRGHIKAALVSEQGFIDTLLEESRRKGIWEKRLGSALSELMERLLGIEKRHEALMTELEWLLKNLPRENDTVGPEEEAARLISAKQLLQNWAVALMDVQEGVLFRLRRQDIRCQPLRLEDTWERWKRRNCGGTSCYDASSIVRTVVRDVKEVFIEEKGNPVAEVARDEMDWAKDVTGDWTPQIWKSIYEDACCKVDFLSYRLKSGSRQEPRVATIGSSIPGVPKFDVT